MSKYLSFVVLLLAACGDNSRLSPDAPVVIPDAPATPDATPCNLAGYPMRVERVSVDLGAPFNLTLDGQGTRCEQLVRALTDPDPTKRPPELAQLDVVGVTGSCTYDDVLMRDIVRLQAPLYAGLPLYAPVQDVLVHIGHPTLTALMPTTVVYLHGDFLAAGAPAVNAACLDATQLASKVPGLPMGYTKFDACNYVGDGSYTIAASDQIQVGDEGLIVDSSGQLRRVRAVDVYLATANLTPEIENSDAFCCTTDSYAGCVGQRLYVDVLTGELVSQTQHCHTC